MYYVQPTIKTQLTGEVVVKCDSKSVGGNTVKGNKPRHDSDVGINRHRL